MKFQKMSKKELIVPDYNPRVISEQELDKLKRSISEFGYIEPIIVNTFNNHIIIRGGIV